MRIMAAGPALVLALVLAGCGGGGDAGDGVESEDPAVDATAAVATPAGEPSETTAGNPGGGAGFGSRPCELLDAAAVEAATGVSDLVATAVPVDATSGLCSYGDSSGAEVVLSVWEGDMATAMWTTLDAVVSMGAEDVERVDGLGTDALWSSGDGTLVLNKGGPTVQVAVRLPDLDTAGVRSIAEDLARRIAEQL